MRRFIAIIIAIALCNTTQAQWEDVTIKATHVGGQVHMLEGRGGNIAVFAGADGILLVDDQYAPLSEKIRSAVGEIHPGPVRFIVNTHYHSDHTQGNEEVAAPVTVVFAHDNVRERMTADQFIAGIEYTMEAAAPADLPVVTFSDNLTFHFNGEAVTAYHAEIAHTDGDSIIHFPNSNVIHMGDVFFNGRYPLIDHNNGGTVQGMISAVQFGLGLCRTGTRVIPGHGPLGDCADLETYGQMLADTSDRVRGLIEGGKTLEEIIAARPTADLDEKYGQNFIKPDVFVGFLFVSLTNAGE
jgi:glyoxylase-like metal-dependent hydrolase (beta-lactamase superfamily II)